MEYLESTVKTLILDILICWKWLGAKPQTSIMTLMQLSHIVLWVEMLLVVLEIKNAQWNLQEYIIFQYYYNDVIMGSIASQMTSLNIVYSAV